MTEATKDTVIYKLNGRDLQAAVELESFMKDELTALKAAQAPEEEAISAGVVNKTYHRWQQKIFTRLKKDKPGLLFSTGMSSPVTQIEQETDGEPRAYKKYNKIFATADKNPDYYMICPVDYRGDHQPPQDATRLDEEQRNDALRRLFAGGWLGNAPLLDLPDTGVDMPYDFDSIKAPHIVKKPGRPKNDTTQAVFLAKGKTLALIDDHKAAMDGYQDSVRDLLAFVDDIMPRIYESPAGEKIETYTNKQLKHKKNKAPQVWVSLRNKGGENRMAAGQPLPLQESNAFTINGVDGHDVHIVPRTDTADGRKFKTKLDALPEKPDFSKITALKNPYAPAAVNHAFNYFSDNFMVPRVQDIGKDSFLLYTVKRNDPNNKKLNPPGAKPVSTALYLWLEQDRVDHQLGRLPPPMPDNLQDEFETLHKNDFGRSGYNRFLPPDFGL